HRQDTAKQKEPRASTSDAEARVMKMPDGGFRPAYNGQLASDPETQVIVAVDIDTTGSDHGLIGPVQDQIRTSYGQTPKQYVVDGGFTKLEDIEKALPRALRCSRRRPRTSTRPTRWRRAPTMAPEPRHGASECRGTKARRSIALVPSRVCQRRSAQPGTSASAAARARQGPGGAVVVRCGAQADARRGAARGGKGRGSRAKRAASVSRNSLR